MKHLATPPLTLSEEKTTTLCDIKVFGTHLRLTKTASVFDRTQPMLFVYAHKHNPWAMDLITRFRADLSAWYEGDTLPDFDCISVSGDRGELQDQLRNHPYLKRNQQASHIISIGDWCSQEVARFRQSYQMTHIAQIFCTQNNPEILDLKDANGNFIVNTNGVYATNVNNYYRQIRTLRSIRPDVTRVAIAFDPKGPYDCLHDHLQSSAEQLEKECRVQGLTVVMHHLSVKDHPKESLETLVSKVDAIITLRDNTAYTQMNDIIAFGTKHGITILTSELCSVLRGAAVGFGNVPGMYVPHMVRLIVQQKVTDAPPLEHLLPEAILEEERMAHNRAALSPQGVKLTQEQEDLLDMVSVHLIDA